MKQEKERERLFLHIYSVYIADMLATQLDSIPSRPTPSFTSCSRYKEKFQSVSVV